MRGLESMPSRYAATRGLSTSSRNGDDGSVLGPMKPPKRCVRPAEASVPLVSRNAEPPAKLASISASSAEFSRAQSSLAEAASGQRAGTASQTDWSHVFAFAEKKESRARADRVGDHDHAVVVEDPSLPFAERALHQRHCPTRSAAHGPAPQALVSEHAGLCSVHASERSE